MSHLVRSDWLLCNIITDAHTASKLHRHTHVWSNLSLDERTVGYFSKWEIVKYESFIF